MKQKKLMFLVASFATVTALIASSATAMALDSNSKDSDISLKFGDNPSIPLINPNNASTEENPKDVDNNVGTGQIGELTIDEVPKTFNFGSHRAGSGPDTFNLNPDMNPKPDSPNAGNYVVQFTDTRTKSGYSVLPKVSMFSDGNGNDMVGASINFAIPSGLASGNGPMIQGEVLGHEPPDAAIGPPTAYAIHAPANGQGYPQTLFKGMIGDSNNATGKGSWKVLYNPRDITITIPAKNQKNGVFKSTITWVIIPETTG